jgi:hypothetical protein
VDYDQNCVIIILALTHRFRTFVEKLSAIFLDRITFNCGMADVSYISKQRDFRNSHPEERNGKTWGPDKGLRLVATENGGKYFNA